MTRRVPLFSLLALIVAGVFAIGSVPLWRIYVAHQIATAPYEGYAPDPGQFGGFAVAVGAFLAGTIGALVGVVLSVIAHIRREPFVGLRVFTLIENTAVLGYGIFALFPFIYRP
jgi:hypothetical protein